MGRVDEIQTEKNNEMQRLRASLLRIDVEALKRIEAQYQGASHRMLYGIDLGDTAKVSDCHARIKHTHLFVEWICAQIEKMNKTGLGE